MKQVMFVCSLIQNLRFSFNMNVGEIAVALAVTVTVTKRTYRHFHVTLHWLQIVSKCRHYHYLPIVGVIRPALNNLIYCVNKEVRILL